MPLKPPKSENADLHRKIMERLRRMTNDEFRALTVDAGIRASDGTLTEPYQDSAAAKGSSDAR